MWGKLGVKLCLLIIMDSERLRGPSSGDPRSKPTKT